jgi:AcrR family transcriptional regulator
VPGNFNQVVGGAQWRGTGVDGRRAELVEAAFHLVAQVGFEGLRLRQVAEAIGIDHSTLHHHVATKQDLIERVAEYATRPFWVTMPASADPVAQLRGHLAALKKIIIERPELLIVTAELDLRARRDPKVRALLDEFERGWRESLGDLLDRGTEVGAWHPATDRHSGVELIIAVVKGTRLSPHIAGLALDQLDGLITAKGVPS